MAPTAQLLTLILGGWALWAFWRKTARGLLMPAAGILTTGFLLRALGGQVLFWTSYLGLPIGRSLQLGGGFWFFAPDGEYYYALARTASDAGFGAILSLPREVASPFYVQTLAAAMYVFGAVPSVFLLLNAFCFLGACAAIKWLSGKRPARLTSRPVLFSIAAVSLTPSWVLWACQPLKDTLFLFLAVVSVAACGAWLAAVSGGAAPRAWAGTVFFLVAAFYSIAGIRAYFAVVLLVGFCAASVLLVLRIPRGRSLAAIKCVVLVVLLSHVIVWSGGPFLPVAVRKRMAFIGLPVMTSGSEAREGTNYLSEARQGFDRAGGGTLIRPKLKKPATAKMSPAEDSVKLSMPDVRRAEDSLKLSVPDVRRAVVGISALALPRILGEVFGLYEIGGGRGFWMFAELDTFCFWAALIAGIVIAWRGIRRSHAGVPAVVGLSVVVTIMWVCLGYVVTNYGTLFRHREMVLIGIVLIPLAAWSSEGRKQTGTRKPGHSM